MDTKRSSLSSSIFWGSLFIFLGVGILLDQFNLLDFSNIIGTWWPLLLILAGLIQIIVNGRLSFFPILLIIVGVFFQLNRLNFIPGDTMEIFWKLFWPTILIIMGVSFLLGRFMMRDFQSGNSEDVIKSMVIFGGNKIKSLSKNFLGGEVSNTFGGTELDLRKAVIADDCKLNIMCVFGGVEMWVPENTKVLTNGVPIFGGLDDKTHVDETKPFKTINLYYTAAFGGIDIKN